MTANAARVLSEQGTPGPWVAITHGRKVYVTGPDRGEAACTTYAEDGNVAKIVAAVNALPLVADLLDELAEYAALKAPPLVPCNDTRRAAISCRLLRARDALDAALRGEQ